MDFMDKFDFSVLPTHSFGISMAQPVELRTVANRCSFPEGTRSLYESEPTRFDGRAILPYRIGDCWRVLQLAISAPHLN